MERERSAADALSSRKEEVVALWSASAAELPAASGLAREDLLDCVPDILDALVDWLKQRGSTENVERTVDAHVTARLRQGYSLQEIMTELTMLASCIARAVLARAADPEVEPLALLAGVTAAAIATYQRHVSGEEQSEKLSLRQLDSLIDASIAAGSGELPFDEVAALFARALGVDAATICLIEDEDMLCVAGAAGATVALRGQSLPLTATDFASRLARASEAGVLVEEFNVEHIAPRVRACGVRAVLGHPLRARNALLGVVYVAHTTLRSFAPWQHRYLRTLARRLALLIDNARLVERLRATIDELQKAQELRDRFVAVLAHDLRAPLSAAMLNAQSFERTASVSAAQAAAARIAGNLSRADRMIRDLLDVYSVRAGNPLPLHFATCDVGEVVRGAVDSLEQAFGKRFVVDIGPSSAAARCRWDGDEVHRALWNLGANAVKYGAQDRPVTLTVARDADEITFRVHNEGEPVARERLARLFEPFGRPAEGPARKCGWGLGLTLVRAAAEAHGGRVSVTSDKESGTTFVMTLPTTPDA